MTQGPLARNLFAVAWPVMLSFMLQVCYNLVDAFWLGKLGKSALAAPTITMHVLFIGMSVAMGLGAGGTTLVSQFRGAGRLEEMRRAGGQTALLLGGVGFVIGALAIGFSAPILRLLHTPADAFPETLAYLRWIAAGMPLMFLFFVYQSIHMGMGDSVGPLQINVVSVAVNVVLDPILIFGLGPIPPMGVVGAALATVLARSIASGLGIYRLFRGSRGFRLHGADLRPNRGLIRKILKVGAPMSLGQAGTALGFTLLIGIVNTFGSAVTAAFGVGHRIIHLAMIPAMGLNQANAASVGQNLGAERPDRAATSTRVALGLIAMILLPITTMTFFYGAAISRVFISDPEVVSYGRELFRITSPSVFMFGFVLVLHGSFTGSGHTVPVMILNMARLWALRIPAAYLLSKTFGMGPTGIWWGMFLSNTVTAIAGAIWFSLGTWKKRVIDDEPRPSQVSVPPLESEG